MSSLSEALVATPQREDAGAKTAARYHYQALWGLTLLFQEHSKLHEDYAIIFEFHDDVALTNHSSNPTTIKFYQVKTKDTGQWTVKDLLKQKTASSKKGGKTKLPSIVGKMYDNVVKFADAVEFTTFVSNAPFNFAPKIGNFTLPECNETDQAKIVEHLKSEYSGIASIDGKVIGFTRTDLSLQDADVHAKGKLNKFVVDHLGEIAFSLDVLFRAVVSECEQKSRFSGSWNGFSDLIHKKGIAKSNTESWLTDIKSVFAMPNWSLIAPDLSFPVLEKTRLHNEWKVYSIEVLSPNDATRSVQREIRKHLISDDYKENNLMQIIEKISPKIVTFAEEHHLQLRIERIKVMIIHETHTHEETGKISRHLSEA